MRPRGRGQARRANRGLESVDRGRIQIQQSAGGQSPHLHPRVPPNWPWQNWKAISFWPRGRSEPLSSDGCQGDPDANRSPGARGISPPRVLASRKAWPRRPSRNNRHQVPPWRQSGGRSCTRWGRTRRRKRPTGKPAPLAARRTATCSSSSNAWNRSWSVGRAGQGLGGDLGVGVLDR